MSPWGVLTTRGRLLVVLGLAVTVAGLLLRERDLMWLGLALVALCLAAVVLTRYRVPRVRMTRWVTPDTAPIGTPLVGEVDIDREGHDLGSAIMLFEEEVPAVLGPRPRFTVHHREGHPHREFTYSLLGRQRGRHPVGPLRADIRDPFGLARAVRRHHEVGSVLVTPVVHTLPVQRSLTGGGQLGEAAPQRLGVQGADDVLVREYRAGDDTRRIHWKSSARTGELMVRREEQAWDPAAIVLVDTRRTVNVGTGPEASVEWVVSAGLSVALHLLHAGYRVELVDAHGESVSTDEAVSTAHAAQVLTEHAALMTLAEIASLHAMVATARQARHGQLVVAVVADPSIEDVSLLATTRGQQSRGLAILLDTAAFTPSRTDQGDTCRDAAAWLTVNGWAASVAGAGAPVARCWAELAAARSGR